MAGCCRRNAAHPESVVNAGFRPSTGRDGRAYRGFTDRNGSRITQSRSERADRAARKDKDSAVDRVDELGRDGCVSASGRAYSRSDLERTGEVDIADALRKRDPAIH